MVTVSEKDSVSHVDTALMSTICLVWQMPHKCWRYMLISPCLVRKVFVSVEIWDRQVFKCLWRACLMVCGVIQNPRSLQSGGEAWAARISWVRALPGCCCEQGRLRGEGSLKLCCSSVWGRCQPPDRLWYCQCSHQWEHQNYCCTGIKLLQFCLQIL